MEITEVRIKLMEDPGERLCAFCSLTIDGCFVVRDLKIIQGAKGAFVAMPSRKLTDRCPKCHFKNHLRATYCNQCGVRLRSERASKDDDGRAKLYADIAHPINCECRDLIQKTVIEAYEEEVVRAKEEGYICTYDDYGEDSFAVLDGEDPVSEESSKPSVTRSYTMETTDGKVHRVDSESRPEGTNSREYDKSKHEKALDAFGDGIIDS